MFQWFKSKEQKAKEELERFQAWLKVKEEAENKAENERVKHEEELRQTAKILEAEKLQALKDSDEPWCDWTMHGTDIDGKVKVVLDWNEAFIHYLRDECGFKGDEDAIIVRYLAALTKSQLNDEINETLNLFATLPESPSAKDAPEEK